MDAPEESTTETDLSVIIPAYNEGEYIGECLESVLTQKADVDYNVFVCDDRSTDNTAEIVRRIEDGRQNVHLIQHSENKGIIDTVKTLTDAADGDFLLRIDADSVLIPGTLQAMYDAFDGGADLVFGRIEVKNTTHLHPAAAAVGKSRGRSTWYGGACIGVDRAKFVTTGGFKESMVGAEVQELKQRARDRGWEVARLDEYGVKSNFPVKLRPVLRRKFDSGRTHVNQYIGSPDTYSIWELRGPIFWTTFFIVGAGSLLFTPLSVLSAIMILIPISQYIRDARLAAKISGQRSFLLLYTVYQIVGAILRTFGVWRNIDTVFDLLMKKYIQ